MKAVRTAVFPVGGLGTRFLPATKSIPKEMLPVASKPLIQRAFEEASEAGIERFIFVTGRNKNAISNHFDHVYELQNVLSEQEKIDSLSQVRDWLPPAGHVAFVRQREALGLGHAVWCARHFVGDEPFAVLLADELFLSSPGVLSQMLAEYPLRGGNLIGVAEVPREDTRKYGVIVPDSAHGKTMRIRGMVEKPKPQEAPSCYSIVGRYILQPDIFDSLSDAPRGAGGEIQLTDAMARMVAAGSEYTAVNVEGKRFDCGNALGFLEANIAFAFEELGEPAAIQAMIKKYI